MRYASVTIQPKAGKVMLVAPPADKRNTKKTNDKHPPAILTPEDWDVVLPFRWVEIEGWPDTLKPEQITRQAAFSDTWNDDAVSFECSDETLNRVSTPHGVHGPCRLDAHRRQKGRSHPQRQPLDSNTISTVRLVEWCWISLTLAALLVGYVARYVPSSRLATIKDIQHLIIFQLC